MRFAYIGATCDHCTETAWANALRALGHEVALHVPQEQAKSRPDDFCEALVREGVSAVFYSRTHNPSTALGPEWTDRWRALEDRGIATCSLHLDLFWGIPEREEWIASGDPLFTTQLVATPDPGDRAEWVDLVTFGDQVDLRGTHHRNLWAEAGVNHLWSPPAIDRRFANRGTPRDEYRTRYLFVGSEGYHPEYPERGELIRRARERWGDDFRTIGGATSIRGDALADVYASADVVLGDSCFALNPERRIPGYWSDRVPETLGRGGVLVHPHGGRLLDAFPAGIWTGNGEGIDALLDLAEFVSAVPEVLDDYRDRAHASVIDGHLYEHRMARILDALGLGEQT